jgi:hypothetical protein
VSDWLEAISNAKRLVAPALRAVSIVNTPAQRHHSAFAG